MNIEIETTISLDDVANAIYRLSRHQQVGALILLLRSVDSETARRAVERYTED